MMGLGLRPTARILGISHPALLKATRSGRAKTLPDGSYDPEAVRVAMALNSHPVKVAAARSQRDAKRATPARPARQATHRALIEKTESAGKPEPESAPPAMTVDLDELPDSESLAEAARQHEWEKVRALKQKTDREEGLLVELIPVNAFIAGSITRARDELCRIGAELADQLARETDPVKCRALVDDQIFQSLENLKEYQPA